MSSDNLVVNNLSAFAKTVVWFLSGKRKPIVPIGDDWVDVGDVNCPIPPILETPNFLDPNTKMICVICKKKCCINTNLSVCEWKFVCSECRELKEESKDCEIGELDDLDQPTTVVW